MEEAPSLVYKLKDYILLVATHVMIHRKYKETKTFQVIKIVFFLSIALNIVHLNDDK